MLIKRTYFTLAIVIQPGAITVKLNLLAEYTVPNLKIALVESNIELLPILL